MEFFKRLMSRCILCGWSKKIFFLKSSCLLSLCVMLSSSAWAFEILTQGSATEQLGYNNDDMKTNGEEALLKAYVKRGFQIFDVGANVGEWSSAALSSQPVLSIYAFEPIPAVYSVLSKNLASKPVVTNNIAVSDREGSATFFVYDQSLYDTKMSGFYDRPLLRNFLQPPTKTSVPTTTLDAFCMQQNVGSIDFLKIDTEGHESFVLRGAQKLFQEQRVRAIQFEYGGCYQDSQTTLKDVYRLLSEHGFLLFRICPQGLIFVPRWVDSLENTTYSNYFAILPRALPESWMTYLSKPT